MSTRLQAENTVGRRRVVIVGGGFAGLACARALRREAVDVVLVDRRNYHLFQPLLYQVASGSLSPEQITAPLRAIHRGQRNLRVRLGEVQEVGLSARRVVLADGTLEYDYLVVAAGLATRYPAGLGGPQRPPGLKSIEDALEVRSRLLVALERAVWEPDLRARQRLLTFVVVGGGPTGVELAGAIGEVVHEVLPSEFDRQCCSELRIVLVEAGPTILPNFPERLRAKAREQLARRRVELLLDTPVFEVTERGVRFGTGLIEAATVVWAAGVGGVALASRLATALSSDGRVPVAPDCSIPEHPEVFVVGDLALVEGVSGGAVPPVAPAAIQMGRLSARAIRSDLRGESRPTFHYRDKGLLAVIGSGAAVARIGRLELSGRLAWLLWAAVHIATLVGMRDRFSVLAAWAWSWLSGARDGRLIVGRTSRGGAR